jgi:hypothetical protein
MVRPEPSYLEHARIGAHHTLHAGSFEEAGPLVEGTKVTQLLMVVNMKSEVPLILVSS